MSEHPARWDGRKALALLTDEEKQELGRLALEREYTLWNALRFAPSLSAQLEAERAIRCLDDKISDILFYLVNKRGYPPHSPEGVRLPSIIDEVSRRRCDQCCYTEIAAYADADSRWWLPSLCTRCAG